MASRSAQLKKVIQDFRKAISSRITPQKIILFGSYAYGKVHKHSDIDLAVISPAFAKMSDIERIMLLSDLSRSVATPGRVDIDPLGFTEEELQKAGYFDIAAEIRDKGKIVYSH